MFREKQQCEIQPQVRNRDYEYVIDKLYYTKISNDEPEYKECVWRVAYTLNGSNYSEIEYMYFPLDEYRTKEDLERYLDRRGGWDICYNTDAKLLVRKKIKGVH